MAGFPCLALFRLVDAPHARRFWHAYPTGQHPVMDMGTHGNPIARDGTGRGLVVLSPVLDGNEVPARIAGRGTGSRDHALDRRMVELGTDGLSGHVVLRCRDDVCCRAGASTDERGVGLSFHWIGFAIHGAGGIVLAVARDVAEFLDLDGARIHGDAEWSSLAPRPYRVRLVCAPAIADHGDRATALCKAVDPMGGHPWNRTGLRSTGRALGCGAWWMVLCNDSCSDVTRIHGGMVLAVAHAPGIQMDQSGPIRFSAVIAGLADVEGLVPAVTISAQGA